ncbi:MAG: DUF4242 domain-containing protein [Alphaproteobacteria bacterium]|nr:DUF4242 domain-containing protein [Alphaproteobacteria bacterium]
MITVIVERSFEAPATEADLTALAADAKGCFELYGVTFLGSLVSADGMRMTCVYRASDVDSVRTAQRTSGLPYDRIYKGWVFGKTNRLGELETGPG